MADAGIKIRKNKRITDVATDIIRVLDDKTLNDINEILTQETGLTLGEIGDMGARLGNLTAAAVSEGGKMLNSF